MSTLGIVLDGERATVAELRRFRPPSYATFRVVASDARRLADQVIAAFPGPHRVVVSLGAPFVRAKSIDLPPVDARTRRHIVALEPERFFAVPPDPNHLVAVSAQGPFAILAPAQATQSLLAALSAIGNIERIESTLQSIARAAGSAPAAALHDSALPPVRCERGHPVAFVRDVAGGAAEALRVSPEQAALACARGVDRPLRDALMSMAMFREATHRVQRRTAMAIAAAAASLALLAAAAARSRVRLLERVDAAVAADSLRVSPLAGQLDSARRAGAATSAAARILASRSDPLATLAVLTKRLPGGVRLTEVVVHDHDWRVAGVATRAADIVPLLDASDGIADVRSAGAITRFEEDGRQLESFVVAFRDQSRPRP